MPHNDEKGRGKRIQPESDVRKVLTEIHQVSVMQDNLTRDKPTKPHITNDDSAVDEPISRADFLRMVRRSPSVLRHERRLCEKPTEEIPSPGQDGLFSLETHLIFQLVASGTSKLWWFLPMGIYRKVTAILSPGSRARRQLISRFGRLDITRRSSL